MSDKKEIVSASPKVRKLAREFGADIYQIQGSQREGRVSEEDIKSFVKGSITGKSEKKETVYDRIEKLEDEIATLRNEIDVIKNAFRNDLARHEIKMIKRGNDVTSIIDN